MLPVNNASNGTVSREIQILLRFKSGWCQACVYFYSRSSTQAWMSKGGLVQKGFWYLPGEDIKGFVWKTEIILWKLLSNETPHCVVITAPLVCHLPGPFELKLSAVYVVYEDKARFVEFVEVTQQVFSRAWFLCLKVSWPHRANISCIAFATVDVVVGG